MSKPSILPPNTHQMSHLNHSPLPQNWTFSWNSHLFTWNHPSPKIMDLRFDCVKWPPFPPEMWNLLGRTLILQKLRQIPEGYRLVYPFLLIPTHPEKMKMKWSFPISDTPRLSPQDIVVEFMPRLELIEAVMFILHVEIFIHGTHLNFFSNARQSGLPRSFIPSHCVLHVAPRVLPPDSIRKFQWSEPTAVLPRSVDSA